MTGPARSYYEFTEKALSTFGDELLAEDLDLLIKYIVLRFLRTSPIVFALDSEEKVESELEMFLIERVGIIAKFIQAMNSYPADKIEAIA